MEHNYGVGHLITTRPDGFMFSWNRKTYGEEAWSARYNYPDQGLSFSYQDMRNPHLGKTFAAFGHFNFYFLNRKLMLKVAQGLAYNTNPYHRETNNRNKAFGTPILSATAMSLNYVERNLMEGIGLQAGFTVFHYSNGNFKAPNSGINTFSLNAGLNYRLHHKREQHYINHEKTKFSAPIHLNFALRTGINSSSVIGMGQFPFLTGAMYLDKQISHKSILQAGTEVFLSPMLKEMIKYEAISVPERETSGDEKSTRISVFLGYQLVINKFSFFTHFGYYAYYPFNYQKQIYNRLGVQRALPHNFFVSFSVKSHAANAENAALSLGYRL